MNIFTFNYLSSITYKRTLSPAANLVPRSKGLEQMDLCFRFQPKLKSSYLSEVWRGKLANGEELICAEPNPNSVNPKSMKLEGIEPGSLD